MRIGVGLITQKFLAGNAFYNFIHNAEKYGWAVDSSIICHGGLVDQQEVDRIGQHSSTYLVNEIRALQLEDELAKHGITQRELNQVIIYGDQSNHTRFPYGIMRNKTILKAMLLGLEVLFFIDSDVFPKVIDRSGHFTEVDFFGNHMKGLSQKNVQLTTSDYSGYYIVPPLKFNKTKTLLKGLGKEAAADMVASLDFDGLMIDDGHYRQPFITNKILGGNLAMELKLFKKILPFYSSTFVYNDQEFATRGEDTILGYMIASSDDVEGLDIDTKIFHDTYGTYPVAPDIFTDQAVKDRFYYAAMGWLGRNPFMYWLKGLDYQGLFESELEALSVSVKEFAHHIGDERFLHLPEAAKVAYAHLDQMIEEYKRFEENWWSIMRKLERNGVL